MSDFWFTVTVFAGLFALVAPAVAYFWKGRTVFSRKTDD